MALGSQALRPCYKDLPRFVLDTGTYDENKPVLIDAAAPERAITKAQAKVMVERTAQGLQAVGLKRGDTVCVVHLNDVRQQGNPLSTTSTDERVLDHVPGGFPGHHRGRGCVFGG